MAGYPPYGAPGPAETASHAVHPGDPWAYGAELSPGDSYATSYPGHKSQYGSAGSSSSATAAPAASNPHDYGWYSPHGGESHAAAPPTGHPPSHDAAHPPSQGAGHPPSRGAGHPPSHGAGRPPSHGAAHPPAHGAGHPPSHAVGHPPSHQVARAPAHASAHPSSRPAPAHMESSQQQPAPWNQPSHAQEYNYGGKGTPASSSMPASTGSSSYPQYGAAEGKAPRYYGQPDAYGAESSRPPASVGAPPPGQKAVAPPQHAADTRSYARAAAPPQQHQQHQQHQSDVPHSRAPPPSHSAPAEAAPHAPATSQSGASAGGGGGGEDGAEPYGQRSASTSGSTSFRGSIYDFGNSPLRRSQQSYPGDKPKASREQAAWRASESAAEDAGGRERETRGPVRPPAAQVPASGVGNGRPAAAAYGGNAMAEPPPPSSHRLPPAAHRASPPRAAPRPAPPRATETQEAASRNAVRSSLLQKLAAGAGDQVGLTGAQIDQVVQVVKLLNSNVATDANAPQPAPKPVSTARYADKAPIETDVASPDYGVSLMFSKGAPPPLVPIPAHLRKVAECGDYLHFHHLMFNAMHPPGAVKVAQEEAKHKGNRDVLLTDGIASIKGIDAWLLAWSRFARCYLDKHPGRAMELIRYQCFVVEMSASYSTPAWLSYDAAFRQLQSRQRDARWDRPDPELFRIWFTAERRRIHPIDGDLQQSTPQVVDALPMPPGVAFPYLGVLPPPITGFPQMVGLPGVSLAAQASLGMLAPKAADLPTQSYKAFTAVPSSSPAKMAASSTPSTRTSTTVPVSSSSGSSFGQQAASSTRTQTSPSGRNPVSSPAVRKSGGPSASSDDKWKPVSTGARERPGERLPYSNKSEGGARPPPAAGSQRGNPSHRGQHSRSASASASGPVSEQRSYAPDSTPRSNRPEDPQRTGTAANPYWIGRR